MIFLFQREDCYELTRFASFVVVDIGLWKDVDEVREISDEILNSLKLYNVVYSSYTHRCTL